LRPDDDSERRRRTYRFLVQAAERARALDAARGLEFYRQAAAMSSTDAERGRALLEQSILEFESVDESAALCQAAIEAFKTAADREGEAEATSYQSSIDWYRGNAARADEYAGKARRLVDELPPNATVAKVLNSVASQLQLRGREEEALDLVDRTLAMAQSIGDTTTYSKALVTRGSALTQLGDFSAIGQIEEALEIQLDRSDSDLAMRTFNNIATFYAHVGEVRRSQTVIDQAIDYGKQRGLPAHVDWSEMTKCEALFPLGEWDEVLEIARRLTESDKARGGTQVGPMAIGWEALVRFLRGETGEPRRMSGEFLSSARDAQDPQGMFPALAGAVATEEACGDPARARALATEFTELGLEHPVFLGGYLGTAAPSMVRLGMLHELSSLHNAAYGGSPWLDSRLGTVAGLLAEANGDHQAALDLHREVWEVGDPLGQRYWTAVARVDAARCALVLGRVTEAGTLLAEAETAATAMGATRLLDDINALRGEDQSDAVRA
jgi:tetratricopeptide (TPR) repeat protein